MLSLVQIVLSFHHCNFCGCIHPSRESAGNHGCDEGEPKRQFRRGEEVLAAFDQLSSDGRVIGTKNHAGRVLSYRRPIDDQPDLAGKDAMMTVLRGDGDDTISLEYKNINARHQWLVEVEPLYGEGDVVDTKTQYFYESDLEKVVQK